MRLDDQLQIDTPEGARLTLSPAGPLPRALAYGIDLLIRVLAVFLIAIPLMMLGRGGSGFYLLLLFLMEWFYPVAFEVLAQGRTPGKKALGLAVVHSNGAPVSLNGSLVRNLLRTADLFPFCYLTGFIVTLIASRQQRLGDLAADTLVIHTDYAARRPHEPSQGQRCDVEAPDWPLDRDDQLVLLAFAERAGLLSGERRRELAQRAYPELNAEAALQRLDRVARHLQGTAPNRVPEAPG